MFKILRSTMGRLRLDAWRPLLLLVGVISLIGLPSMASAQPRVALVSSEIVSSQNTDVQTRLMATGRFSQVDIIDVAFGTPSLATLQTYDAVMVWNNAPFSNRDGLGDVLADYVDGGGGVVLAVYATAGVPNSNPGGRFLSGGYALIDFASSQNGLVSFGVIQLPGDPLMDGVSSFTTTAHPQSGATLKAGATRVASWSDGAPLVVKQMIGSRLRVDLGFYPPDATDPSATTLMANALVIAGETYVAPVPTLSEWAMILLGLTLAGAAAVLIQRRRLAA